MRRSARSYVIPEPAVASPRNPVRGPHDASSPARELQRRLVREYGIAGDEEHFPAAVRVFLILGSSTLLWSALIAVSRLLFA